MIPLPTATPTAPGVADANRFPIEPVDMSKTGTVAKTDTTVETGEEVKTGMEDQDWEQVPDWSVVADLYEEIKEYLLNGIVPLGDKFKLENVCEEGKSFYTCTGNTV